MFERNQSFDIQDKSFENIQNIIEDVLEKKLFYSTNTTRLGKSLIRINYFGKDSDKQQQKDNRITILQEQGRRAYIQMMGELNDAQVEQLWGELEDFLNMTHELINHIDETINNSEETIKIIEILPSKDELIEDIKFRIEDKGYHIENEEIENFINNFIEEYNRLPKPGELDSIVKGYTVIVQEENNLNSEIVEPIIEEFQEEELQEVVPSEELLQEATTQDELTQGLNSSEDLNQEEVLQEELPRNNFENIVLSKEKIVGRRRCPNCGNEGLIREVDDKTKILMDYPKIYAKKRCCVKCGFEWHVE